VRAASDWGRVESRDGWAGARVGKRYGVWEGVLPERRVVEERERARMGGEWVKRPKGAKGCEFRWSA
jgi:hypothetical protein